MWRELIDYSKLSLSQINDLGRLYDAYLFGTGSFLEVGAYDGITHSNTYALLEAGWRGYYMEPITEYYKKCVENTKAFDAHVFNCAAGEYNGEVDMVQMGEFSHMDYLYAYTSQMAAQVVSELPIKKYQYDVPLVRLDKFIADQGITDLDLLIIDTEGAEYQVLQGLGENRPRMIIVELHEKSSSWLKHPRTLDTIEKVYKKLGRFYNSVYADDINTVFVKS